jgi:UDP-4-amino-4,6-dideoxy-N-acetyl-beta-L-altrosamine transaminase
MALLTKRKEFLPYALHMIEEEEIQEVVDTLKSNWITKGPKTLAFEKEFAEYVGCKHAVAMNSCTAALHIALAASGIGRGDEVITTPMTFASTASTIIHTGARPVFVDIEPDTGCMDPSLIEDKITEKTRAIVPVHYAGQACDMDPIMDIAERHGLFVSEDAAHAINTTYKGKRVGSIGNATSFSFYATKNLTTAEGGMLTTNDDELADRARIMSLHGMSRNAWTRYQAGGSWYYEVEYPGFKYNMTDIQAALGLMQLRKIDRFQALREEYANMYNEAFREMEEIEIPHVKDYGVHAWHLYVIKVNHDHLIIDRNAFIEELTKRNIGTSVHFIPVHLHPYYSRQFGYKEGDFPAAEKMYSRIISLPLYPRMTKEDVQDVISAVQDIVTRFRK